MSNIKTPGMPVFCDSSCVASATTGDTQRLASSAGRQVAVCKPVEMKQPREEVCTVTPV